MIIKQEHMTGMEFLSYLWSWHQGWINYLWFMGSLVCIYVFPLLNVFFDNNNRIFCNLRRAAATGAFASGHPAEPNGHLH